MNIDQQPDPPDPDEARYRLASYGTLAPGRPNAHQLDGLRGHWAQGHVRGRLVEEGWGATLGYPALDLDPDGPAISVQIFESPDLPAHWARLDEFEGSGYRRVPTRVRTPTGHLDAYIYISAVTQTDLDLTTFRALSFDCYGTLIDWETGLAAVLKPWAREHGLELTDEELLLAYGRQEAAVERETPSALYPDVLGTALRRTGDELGRPVSAEWAERLGRSVPDWPAFPDSAEALARLGRHYRLIILSNVHRDGFAGSNQRLHGDFAAVITAEDVGAYKPAENHFRALDATLRDLGVDRGSLLHVAQSLFHDHVPAKREGLRSVWINRRHDRPGWGATPAPSDEWTYDLEFGSMSGFADAVDRAFAD